ncbi:MAG: thermonuclease family protein [Ignavibacteria bacterium]|nr:thermonuclease family protein [Ignavibacteria bacterium]
MMERNIIIVILVFIAIILFNSCNETENPTNNTNIPTEPILITTVIEITDGDTYSIYYKNQKWKVRVLKVDAYETTKGTRLTEQARKAGISIDSALSLGLKAKTFAKITLLNKKAELRRDNSEPNIDSYGRLLRITIIDGMRYDSLLKANGLAVPE